MVLDARDKLGVDLFWAANLVGSRPAALPVGLRPVSLFDCL